MRGHPISGAGQHQTGPVPELNLCNTVPDAVLQGHEIELLDQLTGGLVVPTAAGEDGAAGGLGATASQQAEAAGAASGEAFRPSTFSFLRTLRSEETESRGEEEGGEGSGVLDPAAAEATRRAFEGAVLAQWQRLRAARVA